MFAENADAVGAFDPLTRDSLKAGDTDRPGPTPGIRRQQTAPPLIGTGVSAGPTGDENGVPPVSRQSFRRSKMLYELLLMNGTSFLIPSF